MSASITEIENRENGFTALINRLRANPRLPLLIAASAAIAVIVALLLWTKNPDYQVLYTNLSDSDGGDIVTELSQLNIPYRFAENGGALLIPADKVHETRLRLAQKGLPKGGGVGFELLDQEKFGISQFNEQINYQRALEGELARTIETLGPVKNARVHLALPKPSLFIREQKSPTASVTLTLQPGRALDQGQINAITHMVSSSVAGLPASKVTVVDQSGNLLTQSENNAARDLNATQLKFTHDVESRYQRRIEAILAPVVGHGNVHAEVTAQLDFSAREQTIEEYKPNQPPNQAAVRSKQLSLSEQTGLLNVGGVPGALSNQPSAAPVAPIEVPPATNPDTTNINPNDPNVFPNAFPDATGANTTGTKATKPPKPESFRRDETTNYEVDRTIRHIQQQTGAVQRLSVAVVVNYLGEDKDGNPKPLSKDQLTQIEALTREAMGFSAARGDSLNVVNAPFSPLVELSESELPFWKQQRFYDLLIEIARYLVLLIIAWIVWRKLIKPQLVKRQLAAERAEAIRQAEMAAVPETTVELSEDELAQLSKSKQRMSTEMRVKKLRELAEKDPRVVALVLSQWMREEK